MNAYFLHQYALTSFLNITFLESKTHNIKGISFTSEDDFFNPKFCL